MKVILSDKQDITRFAIKELLIDRGLSNSDFVTAISASAMKNAIAQSNAASDDVAVIIDYTDLNITEEELLLLHIRYSKARFLFFSEQLSRDFLRRMLLGNRQFSVVLKDSPLCEVKDALSALLRGSQYICTDAQILIDTPDNTDKDISPLTKTEKDILRLMAMGKKSKQIAEERFLSVYTVVTHRKNIFRKLGVNNAQEAVRYALRAGIVDPLEYYI